MKTFAVLLLFLQIGCSSSRNFPLFEYPLDWKDADVRSKTISDYSNYISGKKIFLDPGHGGEDRRNKSRNGVVVEADVNLRVALALKEYLEKAGATVFISRDKDTTVELGYRSVLANNSGADIFISIHHNAPGKTENDYTNYTSVYYHAKDGDYEYEPFDQDIARYIQRDLSYVMGNPGGLGSFDGTYSDYNIYPGQGFSVLRKTKIPAVLIEGAFHTSRIEELRLNNESFNRIQAWGIFRGLSKYFRAGIPTIALLTDSTKYESKKLSLSFLLSDKNEINHKTVAVYFNKMEVDYSFNKNTKVLSVKLEEVAEGEYPIRIICANKNGNHAFPYHKRIVITNNARVEVRD
ncbi:MAG: cell wall hydrolase/autolysin [Ignavibacteria bacterium]|nr:MAG: cell wall hydrolase/autolysin [Ignavibacteria bacterium]KAF0159571.1 MAG: cell wall hydrolase/autolysin [Ignavibacteria bacterium]